MHHVLRRLRAVAGMAGWWATVWAALGVGIALWRSRDIIGVVRDGVLQQVPLWLQAARGAWLAAPWGAVSGVVFASLLIVLSRRRADGRLSTGTIAASGALAVVAPTLAYLLSGPTLLRALPMFPLAFNGISPLFGLLTSALGASVASGLWLVARRDGLPRLRSDREARAQLGGA